MEINLKIVAAVLAVMVAGGVGRILLRWSLRAVGVFIALAIGAVFLVLLVALVRELVTGGVTFSW